MSGEDTVKGLVYLETKIFDIKKKTQFFVIEKENFKYDLLIGLDSIRNFRLCQNEKLQVLQAAKTNEKKKEEEKKNSSDNMQKQNS